MNSYRGRQELANKITNSNDKIDQLYSLRHLRADFKYKYVQYTGKNPKDMTLLGGCAL